MQAPWLPTVLNMLEDILQWCPIIKDLIMDVLVGQVLRSLQYLHLTLWLLSNVCYADGFSSSVCQVVAGATQTFTSKVYQQCWKEWAGQCAQQGLTNNAISAPKLANLFLLHLLQDCLAWCTIGIYHSAISAFLEPYWLHKASNHPVISKLMHHFIYSIPLPVNALILGMLSICYLFWKCGHQLLLPLPLI